MLKGTKNYLSLIKFSHTIFAMPFALIGFFLAIHKGYAMPLNGMLMKLALVLACMVFARSAAMAFNRYLDRAIDAKNPRTAIREIPAGIISSNEALMFTIVMALLFVLTTLFINRVCFFLSPIALFIILFYSYTKRFTPLCHLVLGLGLSLAPIGAWLAVSGKFAFLPLILSIVVICWVSGFDIIYSLQDEEFDRKNNLRSIPAWLGKSCALWVSRGLHFIGFSGVIVFGWLGNMEWLYWIGALVFFGMLIYQHSIVNPNNLKRVNIAFMTANGIASFIFAVVTIADLYL